MNHSLFDNDNNNVEFLLQPHQVRDSGIMVDDNASMHIRPEDKPFSQSIIVDNINYSLNFDGWKLFATCYKPSEDEMSKIKKGIIVSC